jgi:hypothetical protein
MEMQARQALIYPRRSFSLGIVIIAMLAAAALGLANLAGGHTPVVSRGISTSAQHQQAPDATDRNVMLRAAQSGTDSNQAPDAKDRNAALRQGK